MNAWWFLGSFFLGIGTYWTIHRVKTGGIEKIARQILHKANQEAKEKKKALEQEFKEKAFERQIELEKWVEKERKKIAKEEEKLEKRENKIDSQLSFLEQKRLNLLENEESLQKAHALIEKERADIFSQKQALLNEFEHLSGLTSKEVKSHFLEKIAKEAEEEARLLTETIVKTGEEEGHKKAANILITAINRLSVSTVSEASVISIALPHEEMKRRLIGREGRNIRAFEHATGVNVFMDDTPNTVVISGFDPIRKEIAKWALKELIRDGRIHPTRIEECVETAKANVAARILETGKNACLQAKVTGLHPELIERLGKLYFCYNQGQNILEHSLEVSHLMGLMASELGQNPGKARRIGLLHDIGKAASHEYEGSHALVGYELALHYGENEEIANGIGCHHEEMPPLTLEACLITSANQLSSERPGARLEAIEQAIKRMRKLEALAEQFPGVEKAFALQSGHEMRVIVEPDHFDDKQTHVFAKELAKKIEKEMSFSGQIKITVIREKRFVEYAK